MANFPPIIEAALTAYHNEMQLYKKLNRLVDTFEALIKFLAIIAIQDFYQHQDLVRKNPKTDQNIRKGLNHHPGLGTWMGLLEETVKCFATDPDLLFCKDLYLLHYRGFWKDPEPTPLFFSSGAAKKLRDLRNTLRHGATLSENDSNLQIIENAPYLEELLEKAAFLKKLSLVYLDTEKASKPSKFDFLINKGYISQKELDKESLYFFRVHLFNFSTKACLDLSPLIIYAKCHEYTAVWSKSLGKQLCDNSKLLFFNDLKRSDQIEFLDYWQGHHSFFSDSYSFVEQIKDNFHNCEPREGDWFSDFIQLNTEDFVGREKELEALNGFINDHSKKVLIVVGNPGAGKTTLLGKCASDNDYPRHFLRESEIKWLDPKWFFENLTRQISSRYDVNAFIPRDISVVAYQEAFKYTISRAAEKVGWEKGNVVIIIDGLDEAERYAHQHEQLTVDQKILNWLPSPIDLPRNVKIVLSTRRNVLKLPVIRKKFNESDTQQLDLNRMSNDEIRLLITKGYSKYEVIDHPEFIEEVTIRSEGSPLYVKLLLDDLISGRLLFGDLSHLPKGLQNYFDQILDYFQERASQIVATDKTYIDNQLQSLAVQVITLEPGEIQKRINEIRSNSNSQLGEKCIEMLVLFSIAKQPISLEFVKSVLDIKAQYLDRIFGLIRSVLIEPEDAKYMIFHSGFREYLLNLTCYDTTRFNRYEEEIINAKEKLLSWCRRWPEHKNEYALAHFLDHLLDEKGYQQEIYELAKNEEFLELQETCLSNGIQGSLNTIQTALSQAIENRDIPYVLDFLFGNLSRVERLRVISPIVYVRSGFIEKACSAADLYDMPHNFLWYLLIAYCLLEQGATEDSVYVLRKWTEKGIRTPVLFNWEYSLLEQVVLYLLEKLLRVDTYRIFWEILGFHDYRIIRFLIDNGLLDEALTLTHDVNDLTLKYDDMCWIAIEQVRQGQSRLALHTVLEIKDGERRSKALKEIIETKIVVDLYNKTKQKNKAEGLQIYSEGIYCEISRQLAKIGDYLAAIRTLQYYVYNLENDLLDEIVLESTYEYLDGRSVEGCFKILPDINNEEWRERVVWAVVFWHCDQNNFVSAVDTIKHKLDKNFTPHAGNYRDRKLILSYLNALKKHNPENMVSEQDLNPFTSFTWQLALWQAPIFEIALNGDLVGAMEELYSVIDYANIDVFGGDRDYALRQAIGVLIKNYQESYGKEVCKNDLMTFIEKYPSTRETITDGYEKFGPDEPVVEKSFSIENSDFLENASKRILSAFNLSDKLVKESYENSLLRIVEVFADQGNFSEAISIINIMSIQGIKNDALYAVSMTKAKRGELEEALSLIKMMGDVKEYFPKRHKDEYSTTREIIDLLVDRNELETALKVCKVYARTSYYQEVQILFRLSVVAFQKGERENGYNLLKQCVKPLLSNTLWAMDLGYNQVNIETNDSQGGEFFKIGALLENEELQKELPYILTFWRDNVLDLGVGSKHEFLFLKKCYLLTNIAEYQFELSRTDESASTLNSLLLLIDGVQEIYTIDKLEETFYLVNVLERAARCYSKLGMNSCLKEILEKAALFLDMINVEKDSQPNIDGHIRAEENNYKLEVNVYNLAISRIIEQGENSDLNAILDEYAAKNDAFIEEDFLEWEYPCGIENFNRWTSEEIDKETILYEIADWHNNWPDYSDYPELEDFAVRNFEVVKSISNFWSVKGEYLFAKKITKIMGNEYHRSQSFRDICLAQINAGLLDESIETAFEILDDREEHFIVIAEKLVEMGAVPQFLKLLPYFATNRVFTYTTAGLLAKAFPDNADEIELRLMS